MVRMGVRALVAAALATGLLAGAGAAARAAVPIKMCTVQSMGGAPSFIAKDKGFFAREGLDAKIVTFSSAQPIALAVASGDCDFAATAMTAAFFNLAGQGTLKIIAGSCGSKPETSRMSCPITSSFALLTPLALIQ